MLPDRFSRKDIFLLKFCQLTCYKPLRTRIFESSKTQYSPNRSFNKVSSTLDTMVEPFFNSSTFTDAEYVMVCPFIVQTEFYMCRDILNVMKRLFSSSFHRRFSMRDSHAKWSVECLEEIVK